MTTNQTIDGVPRRLLIEAMWALDNAGIFSTATDLRALLDAPIPFPGYPPVPEDRKLPAAQPQGEPVAQVIDLDAVDWEAIQKAADESNWMPNEYMRNDWIADICNFLKYGRAEQPATVAVVLPERAVKDGAAFSSQLKVNGWNACLDEVTRLNAK